MPRTVILISAAAIVTLVAFGFLLQSSGSLSEALSSPFQAILGTQKQLNATLLEVSETAEPVYAAGRRLLQPLGVVRLVRIYDAPDSDKKH